MILRLSTDRVNKDYVVELLQQNVTTNIKWNRYRRLSIYHSDKSLSSRLMDPKSRSYYNPTNLSVSLKNLIHILKLRRFVISGCRSSENPKYPAG